MKSKILLLFSLCITFQVYSQKHIISGYITDKKSGERLIGTNIYEAGLIQGTISNYYGFYSLALPEGPVNIIISSVGYKPISTEFNLQKDTTITFEMEYSTSEIEEVTITADRSKVETTQMSMIDIPVDMFKNIPVLLGEADVMKVIQLLPGVQSGTEGSTGIYVRGGGPDQNLFLLDGVPVYNASHLFGFFSVFNPDAIKSVQLYKGGFPARFGERLSSVVDIRMKEGNERETHGTINTGIIATKVSVEGPIIKDKSSYIISGRRTYADLLMKPFIVAANSQDGNKASGGYYFYDLNGKVNYKFSDKNRIFLSYYMGSDEVYVRDEYTDDYSPDPADWTKSTDKVGLGWGNIISALRWNYVLSNKIFSNTTLTYSRYIFDVYNDSETKHLQSKETDQDYFRYFSGIQDLSAKIDFNYYPSNNHSVRFGASYTNHNFKPGVTRFRFDNDEESSIDTTFGNEKVFANEFVGYVEDNFSINSWLKMNAGVHVALFDVQDTKYFSLEPRVSVRAMAGDDLSFKLAYSRMSQFVHLLTTSSISLPTDLWLPVTSKIPPSRSHQIAAGFNHKLPKNLDLSVEMFYKTMDNLIEYKEGASFTGTGSGWESKVEIGKGWSYGAEVMIEKTAGKTTGWVGYTLSWSDRLFDNLNFGEIFPAKYDRRHDVSFVVTHKFSDKFDVGLVWVYGTGNAATLGIMHYPSINVPGYPTNSYYYGDLTHYESRNNYRLPSYHRIDLGMNFHKMKKHGKRTWNISAYNAYNRKNPFFVVWESDYNYNFQSSKQVLKQYSLFPIIPSVSYSYTF